MKAIVLFSLFILAVADIEYYTVNDHLDMDAFIGNVTKLQTIVDCLVDKAPCTELVASFKGLSNSSELGSGGESPPCLGEHVKPSALRISCHRLCRTVVPLEYESDRNRKCTCVCTIISPAQLASLNGLAAMAGIGITFEAVQQTCLRCNPNHKYQLWRFLQALKIQLPEGYNSYRKHFDPENKYFDTLEKELSKYTTRVE